MKKIVTIGFVVVAALLAWPQYQKHQRLEQLKVWAAEQNAVIAQQRAKKKAEHDELFRLICRGVNNGIPGTVCGDFKE